MTARRYQLRKDAVTLIERHPWLFREQMSSAAKVFGDGQWLRLVDGANQIVGYGMYEADGAIAIRRLRLGATPPNAAWARAQLAAAIAKRAPLAMRTDAIRLVHGESDGLPAAVIDRFGDAIVVASYSIGADALARYLACVLASEATVVARARTEPPTALESDPALAQRFTVGPARTIIVRAARRRRQLLAEPDAGDEPPPPARVIRGTAPELVPFTEDGRTYTVDLASGHKTGSYLDLRGLRDAIATAPLAGARVLNLFSYTGMLARSAELAGAAEIVSVDVSERALQLAAAFHVTDPAKHRLVTADVFEWLPSLDPAEQFDLAIVDPPAMTSKMAQIPTVLAAYRKLYRAVARHVRPGGAVVAACCTSRIERDVFKRTVREALGEAFTLERELPVELDHPVAFAQADYLKITWWRRATEPSAS
jgi:23S rRNA (cytosine1962-C5)-methyltransferase